MYKYTDYPENKLSARLKLSYKWLPENSDKILDGGCSYGYGTRFFRLKSKETYGIDSDENQISVAKLRYPDIHFKVSRLESTSFESEFFDVIILNDVLEHTTDKIKSLSESFRILKTNGLIIISTPHKGLFTFLDPYNYGYLLRTKFSKNYNFLYNIIYRIKKGIKPVQVNPAHLVKHFHYSLNELKSMLDLSDFKDKYIIEKVFRSGLFMEVFTMNCESILNIIFAKKVTRIILKPFAFLSNLDYWIRYGIFSYNIAIKVKKI
ncbi:MAG: class I SAM-dependent methyltransferase [FCB group bacterium]